MKNTLKQGSIRTMIFKENDVWYGVALELNLVVDASEKQYAFSKLDRAIKSYIKAATKVGDESVLNQKTDSEYEKLWQLASDNKPIPSPIKLGYFGRQTMYA